jgi:oxaloacetate decarboxylase gamma subunit
MPVTELLSVGFDLMLLGMGIVITFLVMLVFVMLGVAKLIGWIEEKHGIQAAPAAAAGGAPVPMAATADSQLIAVISAAVSRYRNTRR